MAATSAGRIIYTRQALPAVELVSFALEGGDIVVRAMRDPVISAIRDSVVAFEADQVSPHDRSGWTVTVIGRACEDSGPPSPGEHTSTGEREHVIRIRAEIVTGCRLAMPAAAQAPPEHSGSSPLPAGTSVPTIPARISPSTA
jgi:hypothetical protein